MINNKSIYYGNRRLQSNQVIPIIVGFITIIIGIVCFILSANNSTFSSMGVLPLLTGFIILAQFKNVTLVNGISALVIGSLYYIRNVIGPLILVLDNYQSKFNSIGSSDVNNAVVIMCYETIAVCIAIAIEYKRTSKLYKKSRIELYTGDFAFRISLIIGVLIILYALLGSEQLRGMFYSVFTPNFYEVSNDIVSSGSGKILYNGGKVLIDSLRLVIPAVIIIDLRKRSGSTLIIVYISILIAFCQVLFMTDGNAYIFILVIVQLILIYRIHPGYRATIKRIMYIGAFVGIFLIATHRFLTADSAYKSVSTFVQSYFGGICDVAGIFRLPRENPFTHMLIDFYSAVPFRSTLFGYSGNDVLTVKLYNAVNNAHSQILPTISESYYFFGVLLSPLLSVLFVIIGVRFEKKAKEQKHYLYYVLDILVCLIASMCPITYDMRIFLTNCLNSFIFMWVFIRLSKGCTKYIIEEIEE